MINGDGKINHEQFFEKVGERHGTRTRIAEGYDNLRAIRARTELRKFFFPIRAVNSWNNLPDEVKQSRTVNSSKKCLRSYVENGGRLSTRPARGSRPRACKEVFAILRASDEDNKNKKAQGDRYRYCIKCVRTQKSVQYR
jgi:hypothetical protein